MTSISDLNTASRVRVINSHAQRAITFRALDKCADLARENRVWNICVSHIHDRNMSMLGKKKLDLFRQCPVEDEIFYDIGVIGDRTQDLDNEADLPRLRKSVEEGYLCTIH